MNRRHVIPPGNDPSFEVVLTEKLLTLGIDLVVPTVDEEVARWEALRRYQGVDVLLPGQQFVQVMLDKMGSMAWLKEAGIPVPQTTVSKPRYGHGSREVRIEQEQLTGQEYSVCMVADRKARLHAIVPYQVEKRRGMTIWARTDNQPTVTIACLDIHNARPAAGCYNIQGFLGNGRFLPHEINPRVSATSALAVAAGIDFVAVWLGNAEPNQLLPFRVGLEARRTWRTEIG